jgi:hypothetical protein
MAKNIKLSGTRSFHHPAFKSASGDAVHIKKGDVVRVDDEVADYLQQREHIVGEDLSVKTFVDSNTKADYDFSTDGSEDDGDEREEVDENADGEDAPAGSRTRVKVAGSGAKKTATRTVSKQK